MRICVVVARHTVYTRARLLKCFFFFCVCVCVCVRACKTSQDEAARLFCIYSGKANSTTVPRLAVFRSARCRTSATLAEGGEPCTGGGSIADHLICCIRKTAECRTSSSRPASRPGLQEAEASGLELLRLLAALWLGISSWQNPTQCR